MRDRLSPFHERLRSRTAELGGLFNAHLHLDRAYTLDDRYLPRREMRVLEQFHISLHEKHHLIHDLHAGPAYELEDLLRRVNHCLDMMVACGTRCADTLVDVTADRVGTSALELLCGVRARRANDIELRVGAYSPLGFLDSEPERWELLVAAAAQSDFLAALPEADDTREYPEHIGFMEHCRRFLELAQETGQMLHVHTDQRNEPSERGTEDLLEAIRRYGAPRSPSGAPMVWAVHMVSPSTYDEARFARLVDGLLEHRVGVICCPSAALGMRQLRPLLTPTTNSMPRVLELVAAGVPVRLGCDNIADICSPSTTANLLDEVFVLSAALRYYDTDVLARLAAGQEPSAAERRRVELHLAEDRHQIEKALARCT